jgi:hypothetical protein
VSEASVNPVIKSDVKLNNVKLSHDAIIEAVGVEKSYPQADGTRIQVVGLTNLAIEPGRSLLCSALRAAANRRCCAY